MSVIATLAGSAPWGIATLSAPSLDTAVPPVAPTTVDVGIFGGFWEELLEHRATAKTTSAAPASLRPVFKEELSFMRE